MKNMPPIEQLLMKMMAFQPVTADVKRVNALADFTAGMLRSAGVRARIERIGDRKCVFAATRDCRAPAMLLNAHLDVVPADAKAFTPVLRHGRVSGRGAGDCLGNCAVACRVLAACAGKADIGAVFSSDEETGGDTTGEMIRRGYGGEFIAVMDGESGLSIAIAQKGILALRLTARGKSCHGATPWKGINALDRLIAGYARIKPLFPPAREGDEWHDTMSANAIRAGSEAFNRVPDRAEILLDVRYTEKTRPAALARKIRQVSGLKVEVFAQSPVLFNDPDSPAVRDFAAFMNKTLKVEAPFQRMNGATDARHFAALKRPIVIISVPYKGGHSDCERVGVKWLRKYEDMLTAFALERFPLRLYG